MADEYRLRFKRNCHVVPGVLSQRCYTLRHYRRTPRYLHSRGRLVTYVNLLSHFKTIKELYDTFEEEDLHCAIWRVSRRYVNHHLAIRRMIAVRKGRMGLLIQKRKKDNLKRAQKGSVFFISPRQPAGWRGLAGRAGEGKRGGEGRKSD